NRISYHSKLRWSCQVLEKEDDGVEFVNTSKLIWVRLLYISLLYYYYYQMGSRHTRQDHLEADGAECSHQASKRSNYSSQRRKRDRRKTRLQADRPATVFVCEQCQRDCHPASETIIKSTDPVVLQDCRKPT
ncbi:hypothetical protein OS493_039938, partial [Desmophyllum pertusum]